MIHSLWERIALGIFISGEVGKCTRKAVNRFNEGKANHCFTVLKTKTV